MPKWPLKFIEAVFEGLIECERVAALHILRMKQRILFYHIANFRQLWHNTNQRIK
jgi:hypothetical protein